MGKFQMLARPLSRSDLVVQGGRAGLARPMYGQKEGREGSLLILIGFQGYQWLKEKVQSEDGKKQQARVTDLLPIAHQLGCTVAQLAIGETLQGTCLL